MANRWGILAVLTLVRTAMGIEFQSIAAVSAELEDAFGIGAAALGLLIGLFMLPGILLAVPSGWLGQRFGDKRMVLAGLALMAAGVSLPLVFPGWSAQLGGRLAAGLGAVLINVLVTKMVADWFGPRELPFAMGVLISSWPLGIALAMVTLPALSAAGGWQAGFAATGALSLVCLALLWAVYRPPAGHVAPRVVPGLAAFALPRTELAMAALAGLVWALFNACLITLLSFGPRYLVLTGADPVAAQAVVSALSWFLTLTVAAGGWIATRVDRPDAIIAGGLILTAALAAMIPVTGGSVLLFGLVGLLFGLPAAVIMTLPVEAVAPERRAVGMGIYLTLNYVGSGVAGPAAGWVAEATGAPAAPILLAAATATLALVPLALFRLMQRARLSPA